MMLFNNLFTFRRFSLPFYITKRITYSVSFFTQIICYSKIPLNFFSIVEGEKSASINMLQYRFLYFNSKTVAVNRARAIVFVGEPISSDGSGNRPGSFDRPNELPFKGSPNARRPYRKDPYYIIRENSYRLTGDSTHHVEFSIMLSLTFNLRGFFFSSGWKKRMVFSGIPLSLSMHIFKGSPFYWEFQKQLNSIKGFLKLISDSISDNCNSSFFFQRSFTNFFIEKGSTIPWGERVLIEIVLLCLYRVSIQDPIPGNNKSLFLQMEFCHTLTEEFVLVFPKIPKEILVELNYGIITSFFNTIDNLINFNFATKELLSHEEYDCIASGTPIYFLIIRSKQFASEKNFVYYSIAQIFTGKNYTSNFLSKFSIDFCSENFMGLSFEHIQIFKDKYFALGLNGVSQVDLFTINNPFKVERKRIDLFDYNSPVNLCLNKNFIISSQHFTILRFDILWTLIVRCSGSSFFSFRHPFFRFSYTSQGRNILHVPSLYSLLISDSDFNYQKNTLSFFKLVIKLGSFDTAFVSDIIILEKVCLSVISPKLFLETAKLVDYRLQTLHNYSHILKSLNLQDNVSFFSLLSPLLNITAIFGIPFNFNIFRFPSGRFSERKIPSVYALSKNNFFRGLVSFQIDLDILNQNAPNSWDQHIESYDIYREYSPFREHSHRLRDSISIQYNRPSLVRTLSPSGQKHHQLPLHFLDPSKDLSKECYKIDIKRIELIKQKQYDFSDKNRDIQSKTYLWLSSSFLDSMGLFNDPQKLEKGENRIFNKVKAARELFFCSYSSKRGGWVLGPRDLGFFPPALKNSQLQTSITFFIALAVCKDGKGFFHGKNKIARLSSLFKLLVLTKKELPLFYPTFFYRATLNDPRRKYPQYLVKFQIPYSSFNSLYFRLQSILFHVNSLSINKFKTYSSFSLGSFFDHTFPGISLFASRLKFSWIDSLHVFEGHLLYDYLYSYETFKVTIPVRILEALSSIKDPEGFSCLYTKIKLYITLLSTEGNLSDQLNYTELPYNQKVKKKKKHHEVFPLITVGMSACHFQILGLISGNTTLMTNTNVIRTFSNGESIFIDFYAPLISLLSKYFPHITDFRESAKSLSRVALHSKIPLQSITKVLFHTLGKSTKSWGNLAYIAKKIIFCIDTQCNGVNKRYAAFVSRLVSEIISSNFGYTTIQGRYSSLMLSCQGQKISFRRTIYIKNSNKRYRYPLPREYHTVDFSKELLLHGNKKIISELHKRVSQEVLFFFESELLETAEGFFFNSYIRGPNRFFLPHSLLSISSFPVPSILPFLGPFINNKIDRSSEVLKFVSGITNHSYTGHSDPHFSLEGQFYRLKDGGIISPVFFPLFSRQFRLVSHDLIAHFFYSSSLIESPFYGFSEISSEEELKNLALVSFCLNLEEEEVQEDIRFWSLFLFWGYSSKGRAVVLRTKGYQFNSDYLQLSYVKLFMKSKIEFDKQKRNFFIRSEASIFFLKCIMTQNKQASKLVQMLPQKSRLSSIRNRCIFSYRGRFILKIFKLSRIYVHSYAKKGYVNFLKKASWLIL